MYILQPSLLNCPSLSQGPKALMESALRRYSVLTEGVSILVQARKTFDDWKDNGTPDSSENITIFLATEHSLQDHRSIRFGRNEPRRECNRLAVEKYIHSRDMHAFVPPGHSLSLDSWRSRSTIGGGGGDVTHLSPFWEEPARK